MTPTEPPLAASLKRFFPTFPPSIDCLMSVGSQRKFAPQQLIEVEDLRSESCCVSPSVEASARCLLLFPLSKSITSSFSLQN